MISANKTLLALLSLNNSSWNKRIVFKHRVCSGDCRAVNALDLLVLPKVVTLMKYRLFRTHSLNKVFKSNSHTGYICIQSLLVLSVGWWDLGQHSDKKMSFTNRRCLTSACPCALQIQDLKISGLNQKLLERLHKMLGLLSCSIPCRSAGRI